MSGTKFSVLKNFFPLLLLSLVPTIGHATIAATDYGYGMISKAMGGTGVAASNDSFTSAVNPAGMAFVGHQFDIGATVLNPRRGYTANTGVSILTVAPGSNDSGVNYFLIPSIGYASPFANQKGTWGIATYVNGGLNTDYSASITGSTLAGGTGVYGSGATGADLKQFFLNLSLAWKVMPELSVGASVIPAVQTLNVKGVSTFAAFSSDPAALSDKSREFFTGIGARLGMLYKPYQQIAIGASYQPKIKMGHSHRYAGLLPENGNLDVPATGTVGLSLSPREDITVNVDTQRIWHSSSPAYTNPNICVLFGPSCLGTPNGTGFGLNNVTAYKLGLQWAQNELWTWRAGYVHFNQIVPSSQVLFNIMTPTVVQDHFSVGFTRNLSKQFALNTLFLYVPQKSVEGPNQLNTSQNIKLFMRQYEVGVSLTWKLDN